MNFFFGHRDHVTGTEAFNFKTFCTFSLLLLSLDYTRGNFCESCVPESYGNATTAIGCNPCQCNGHGDPDKGLCDIQNGKCFCIGHTVGDHCENCMPGLAGNPL